MTTKITQKIVGFDIAEKKDEAAAKEAPASEPPRAQPAPSRDKPNVVQMHESLKRPETLVGRTYKLKVPGHVSEHAMYITINDIILNEGTEFELRRPFEMFVNSKNMEHFQWIVALTRIISAVFRKGGDVTFLVEELRSVFDPRGGYWNQGKFQHSLVAELGDLIERHLVAIGLLQQPQLDENQKAFLDAKRAEFSLTPPGESSEESVFPAGATFCAKCNHKSVIMMDGCMTCLNCGDAKCG